MTETILYSRKGHVGRLVLNNAERHNALGREELEGIRKYLDTAAADEQVRVLVITGAGDKTFCAGASLQQLRSGKLDGDSLRLTAEQLADMAVPTICALNGNVFGAGVELALSCDFRIGIEGSRMRVPAASIGICYPPGAIHKLIQLMGLNTTRRILLAAEEFDAQEMHQSGFLDYLVLPGQLEAFTNRLSGQIAGLAPLAVSAMKAIVQQTVSGQSDQTRLDELVSRCANSEDLQEGLAAQLEKRSPRFSGK